jgi:hypothetical protein
LIDHLVRHPNVFADTSGVRRFDLLEQAVRRAGFEKILFGSDGPWLHPGVELAKIDALGLAPAARRAVLGGNFLRLIARVRRGGARGPARLVGERAPGLPAATNALGSRRTLASTAMRLPTPNLGDTRVATDPWLRIADPAKPAPLNLPRAASRAPALPRGPGVAVAVRGR